MLLIGLGATVVVVGIGGLGANVFMDAVVNGGAHAPVAAYEQRICLRLRKTPMLLEVAYNGIFQQSPSSRPC